MFSLISIPLFDKQFKRLLKKYPSLKNDFIDLANAIASEPNQGIALGNNCYKIRLAIKSKGQGKSGGARIITHIYLSDSSVYLLSIYDKSEQSIISDKEIAELLKQIR